MPIKLQGKEYVTHSELVEWATKAGLNEVRTEILHIDIDKKQALIQATATGERGTFQGIGDALPDNVGRMIAVHWIRMAETRAVNRALRLYTGRSTTSIDELADTTPAAPAPADHCRSLIRDLQQADSKALQDLKQWLEQANSSR